ncbi:phosphotransferase [Legionella sp. CNM-1927-20]|uniref:phosphotransferase n=1 Tax=Legionella sp. CNM-1927-20 TaxID=3422221 RepID=UPI00403B371B
MISEHWACNFLKQDISSITSLQGGMQHYLDLIELIDSSKWVCKKFTNQTWLGEITYQQILISEKIANLVADQLGLTYKALCLESDSPILKLKEGYGIIRPFFAGKTSAMVTPSQAQLLGKVLAHIHSLNINNIDASPFPAINWPQEFNCPPWLKVVISECNEILPTESWIVSHRDIHASNLVWQNPDTVHLIDWESAGLIHPGIELIGLACNCAGLTRGYFLDHLFVAVLQGYRQVKATIPTIPEGYWVLIWQSWLLWYLYVIQKNFKQEILATEAILHLLKVKQPILQTLYKQQLK